MFTLQYLPSITYIQNVVTLSRVTFQVYNPCLPFMFTAMCLPFHAYSSVFTLFMPTAVCLPFMFTTLNLPFPNTEWWIYLFFQVYRTL